ncbi:hypothetical protein, partial [Streptomyces sp. RP5T]
PSGEGRLEYDGDLRAYVPALIDIAPDDDNVRVGDWVPFGRPARIVPYADREWTDLVDGSTFRDSAVESFPLVSNQSRRYGRGSIADLLRMRERYLRSFFDMRELAHVVPFGDRVGTLETVPVGPVDPAAYAWLSHGKPGGLELIADGRRRMLDAEQGGRYIAGLPEVQELPDGSYLHLEVCYGATAGDPGRPLQQGDPVPPVDDPLAEWSLADWTAYYSRLDVLAATRAMGLGEGGRVLYATTGGVRGRMVRVRPLPLDEELDVLAVGAGLHAGP